jgi:chromosomal replication initiation ATPase DnaA
MTPREARLAVLREVAARHGVGSHLIFSDSMVRDVVAARWEVMSRLQEDFGDSTKKIGRFLDLDHTTVSRGIRVHRGDVQAASKRRRKVAA